MPHPHWIKILSNLFKDAKMEYKGTRMRISWLAVFAVCMSLCQFPAQQAAAEANYPSRSILIIIAASTGGGTDLSSRVLADALEPLLGQKIGILNKSGGGGAEGLVELARAAPDGYTLGAVFNWAAHGGAAYQEARVFARQFRFRRLDIRGGLYVCARKHLPATDSTASLCNCCARSRLPTPMAPMARAAAPILRRKDCSMPWALYSAARVSGAPRTP